MLALAESSSAVEHQIALRLTRRMQGPRVVVGVSAESEMDVNQFSYPGPACIPSHRAHTHGAWVGTLIVEVSRVD
jgi:hypothetical protein